MARTGSDASEKEDARMFGSIIVTINCSTLVFPLLRKYMIGTHTELMETLIAVVTFPLTCWMKWCGGQKRRDARIAKERAEAGACLAEVVVQKGRVTSVSEVVNLNAVVNNQRPPMSESQNKMLQKPENGTQQQPSMRELSSSAPRGLGHQALSMEYGRGEGGGSRGVGAV